MTTDELLVQVLEEVRAVRLLVEARAEGPLASDADVDGQHGDLEVRFDPSDWKGRSYKGQPMSVCAPEFLDKLARALGRMAEADDKNKKLHKGRPASRWTRSAAAKARRWAYRIRCGYVSEARAAADKADAEAPAPKVNPFAKPAPPAAAAPLEPPPGAGDAWEPPEPPTDYVSEAGDDVEPVDDRF